MLKRKTFSHSLCTAVLAVTCLILGSTSAPAAPLTWNSIETRFKTWESHIFGMTATESAPRCSDYQHSSLPPEICCDVHESIIMGTSVEYCMQRSRPEVPRRRDEPLALLLPGILDSHRALFKVGYSDAIQAIAAEKRDLPPVTWISFRTPFGSFFADQMGRKSGSDARQTWMLFEFLPWLSEHYDLCKTRSCRAIAGFSMGGFGALSAALRYPKFFRTVAAQVPSIFEMSPFASENDWKSYFGRHRLGFLGKPLLIKTRSIFGSTANFLAHSPIERAKTLPANQFPAMYVTAGGKDDYGFNEGYAAFLKILKDRGILAELAKRKVPAVFQLHPEAGHLLFRAPGQPEELVRFVEENLKPKKI